MSSPRCIVDFEPSGFVHVAGGGAEAAAAAVEVGVLVVVFSFQDFEGDKINEFEMICWQYTKYSINIRQARKKIIFHQRSF